MSYFVVVVVIIYNSLTIQNKPHSIREYYCALLLLQILNFACKDHDHDNDDEDNEDDLYGLFIQFLLYYIKAMCQKTFRFIIDIQI